MPHSRSVVTRQGGAYASFEGFTYSLHRNGDAPGFPGASPSYEVVRVGRLARDGRLEDADDTDALGVTGLLVLDLDPDDARLARLDGHADLAVLA